MRNIRLSATTAICTSMLSFFSLDTSLADIFGSGTNTFEIEFVSIGSPGNAADTTGTPDFAGGVGYIFKIGKYEISEDMIAKANAAGGLGITFSNRGENKPTTNITWNEAAQFVNWLNTSQSFQAAYHFDSNGDLQLWNSGEAWQLDGENLYRHKDARYWLPSMNEWYKAAYYDPTTNSYFDFPTGSNTAPTPVANGTMMDTAVYRNQAGPADITLAGGLSPFGTMAQGGNVTEWQETSHNLVNDNGLSARGFRGASWINFSGDLASTGWPNSGLNPSSESNFFGFRVASFAAPSCDFDGDAFCQIEDIDELMKQIVGMQHNPSFDMTGDGLVNLDDRDEWLAQAGALNLPSGNPYLVGDFDLSGTVDGFDFLIWNSNKFTNGANWSLGETDGTGVIDGLDFLNWNSNKFQSSGTQPVPAPGCGVLVWGLVGCLLRRNWRR